MDQIEQGITIAINLPLALSPKKASVTSGGGSPLKKTRTAEPKAAVKPTRATSYRHPSDEHVNDDDHAKWIVAKGVDFQDLFPDRAPGAKRWPIIFTNTRLPKKNKQPRAAPLCVRFQMTGRTVQAWMYHGPATLALVL